MKWRAVVLPLCLFGAACSSETTVQGPGGGGSGGSSGSGASAGAGGSGGSAGADASTGSTGGAAGSGGSTPTGGTGGGGTGGSGGAPSCDAGPVPCGVEIVAQGLTKPFGLIAHDANVYFTTFDNPGQVLTCPKTGCSGAPTPLASNQSLPRRLARSGAKLFWTNAAVSTSGSVMSCDLPCSNPKPVATGQNAPDHVTVSPTHVFFTDATNAIRRCEHTGTNCITMITAQSVVGGLAYSGVTGSLYWSVPSQGYIKSCKATDCATGQPNLIQGNPGVGSIATNPGADTMFSVHDLNPSPLKKCALGGCAMIPTNLTANTFLSSPVSITADDLTVFVLESTSRVSRCAIGGCSLPTVLSDAAGTPGTIAVDDTHVYWTATLGGTGYVLRRNKTN